MSLVAVAVVVGCRAARSTGTTRTAGATAAATGPSQATPARPTTSAAERLVDGGGEFFTLLGLEHGQDRVQVSNAALSLLAHRLAGFAELDLLGIELVLLERGQERGHVLVAVVLLAALGQVFVVLDQERLDLFLLVRVETDVARQLLELTLGPFGVTVGVAFLGRVLGGCVLGRRDVCRFAVL